MIMKFLQDTCERKITRLRDERKYLEYIIRWYPVGSFGYERYFLAMAFIDLKITIWQAFMGET